MASEKSCIGMEHLKPVDEKRANPWLYTVPSDYSNEMTGFGLPMNDMLFNVQSQVIRQLADRESCIIVGRCADYVLKENKERVSIFIYADIKSRAERAVNIYGLKPDKAEDEIRKRDKKRGNYYNYYTNRKWDDFHNYHLLLDSARLGITGSVELIIKYLDMLQCSSPE